MKEITGKREKEREGREKEKEKKRLVLYPTAKRQLCIKHCITSNTMPIVSYVDLSL